ncbi:hypothetical protein QBC38DRAFT_161520 [Podospora fimiseda]|uniref:Uncharacterized protein n=1 Tax=Podospora fimiseda TaxID=252190 RepID=A0AAN7BRN3_9PEZI|nr:hypothetical protein QBC38DRAFT_161520 [Podospora fimiseda]
MASPRSPRHSPHPSLDLSRATSYSPTLERRQSKSSFNDPTTPLRNSFTTSETMDIGVFSSGGMNGGGGAGNGLGNLADELAGAFDDEYDDYDGQEGEYDDEEDIDIQSRGSGAPGISLETDDEDALDNKRDGGVRDSGVDVESPQNMITHHRGSLALPSPNGKRGHRRKPSDYDGSEFGTDSDLESPGMPPRLVEKMDEVDSLVRRGTERTGSAIDGTFGRVTEGLRDLGSQSGLEGCATRLITAHSALTTHINHQTRQLHNLTFPLLSPLVAPPDPETIDSLLPMLVDLSDYMPRPSTTALQSLSSLRSLTSDLVETLNYLSDTLHMSRQTTSTATRRLKSAKDLVHEMRRDEDLREEGERWIAKGNWGERLQRRECAHVCGDVVGGFEEVCNSWRAKLVALAELEAQA